MIGRLLLWLLARVCGPLAAIDLDDLDAAIAEGAARAFSDPPVDEG